MTILTTAWSIAAKSNEFLSRPCHPLFLTNEAWTTNPQITGLAISASRVSGEANYVQHGNCTIGGKSFATIQEEIPLGYLEATHEPDENYAQRIRRRNAFLAGMRDLVSFTSQGECHRLPPVTAYSIKYQQETTHLTPTRSIAHMNHNSHEDSCLHTMQSNTDVN